MTAQVLASELAALIQETKRRSPDIKSAAEKSLADLKALPNTSESQLAADLKRRPIFVRPFLLACASRNPKYAGTSIVCLQRLVVSNGLAHETLKDVLDVLRDCSSLALDIQLKILQVLPSLLQNYSNRLTGDLLATALHICFLLYASKTAAVSNTAAATLQQLVVLVLGKVAQEDEVPSEQDFIAEVPIEDGTVSVRSAALDAYHLLNDLCLLTEGHKPLFLHAASIPSNFGLELIESMLSNHADTVTSHAEQIHVLRIRLMPFIIRVLSERVMFSTTVRVMRLLPWIFGNMLGVLSTECEMVLGLLNHMLDPEAASLWKRVLCMEIFKGIHAEPTLVRSIFSHFDEEEGKRNIVKDNLDIMARISIEKPVIIGLGQQSSIPANVNQDEEAMNEQVAVRVEGIAGAAGVAMTLKSSTSPGISSQWSVLRVPCIDQLDKAEAPSIPSAYLYSLALTCMNSFSDGLARFLLPFSMQNEAKSKRKTRSKGNDEPSTPSMLSKFGEEMSMGNKRPKVPRSQSTSSSKLPANPLSLEDHVLYSQIQTSANMVESCWVALLAAYGTYFHAALDSENYHALVRSFQKFTQVAGLLRLSIPRDAFLTTLSKNAIQSAVISIAASQKGSNQQSISKQLIESAGSLSGSSTENPRQSFENGASLNTRNLLCLRALLNLGIALGPVLQNAWSIIFETLQQADLIIDHLMSLRRISLSGQSTATVSDSEFLGHLGNEISAVKIAATRMLESCGDLPDEAFRYVLLSLKGLIRDLPKTSDESGDSSSEAKVSPRQPTHLKMVGVSGGTSTISRDNRGNLFVVDNLSKLVEYNSSRLLEKPPGDNGWDMIVESLIQIVSTLHFDNDLRIKSARTICDLVSMTSASDILEERRDLAREQGLVALKRQVESLYQPKEESSKASKICELEIHWLSMEGLRAALEQYGDSLELGWDYVFTTIASVFEPKLSGKPVDGQQLGHGPVASKSSKLVRSSFGSLQLICSDFIGSVPPDCFPKLLASIYSFCSQHDEFNIALTSTTLFWVASDYLWQGEETLPLQEAVQKIDDTTDLPNAGYKPKAKAEIWLGLLLLLAETSVDERAEIRHSALHTIFRILDSSGQNFKPEDLLVCQRTVVLRLFFYNDESYRSALSQENLAQKDSQGSPSCWNETAILMLNNFSSLFGSCLQAMVQQENFLAVWKPLAGHLSGLLERRSLTVSTAVFASLEKTLAEVEQEKAAFMPCAKLVWEIWQGGNPVTHTVPSSRRGIDNQDALLAYLRCLAELSELINQSMELEQVQSILSQLYICATGSSPTSYPGDIDSLTPLQEQILTCVEMIPQTIPGAVSELLRSTSKFVTLAYEQNKNVSPHVGPTYIALSKAAIELLGSYAVKHANDKDIYSSGSLSSSIRSLAIPVKLKYKWLLEGKDPPIWMKATSATVAIIKACKPVLERLRIPDSDESPIWKDIVASCDAIASADVDSCPTPSRVLDDQDFDIAAITDIFDLVLPGLGSSIVTDRLRRAFASSLFKNSLIHEPHPDDLPQSGQDILESLETSHIGRTQDLPPTPRLKMSYVLLDRLFDIVAAREESPECVKLAQAAAPFLILRVGIVLKAYVLDQPLRGRMPQPYLQKTEMLYILRKLGELDSEPRAIPEGPGVVSKHKRHIYRIYGVVTKALAVARSDPETLQQLTKVLETIRPDFGV